MNPQETKFTFVYNEIKQCILEGKILPGNALPSSRLYCEQFHVSRYTINRVFNALRKETSVYKGYKQDKIEMRAIEQKCQIFHSI